MVANNPHTSSRQHVNGKAVYVDDINWNDQLLHGKVFFSPHPHALIKSFDLDKAKEIQGVHAILSFSDIPGSNQMGPVIHDEPCLAEESVSFKGQAIFLIAAKNEKIADQAAKAIKIQYEILKPILEIEESIKRNDIISKPRQIKSGDVDKALSDSPHVIQGELRTGAQEHWYLETQACLSVPEEDGSLKVFSSTQHPSETQSIVAEVTGLEKKDVEVEVKRLGGAFGGKETQANHIAAWASLLAQATCNPVKIRLSRDEDQEYTGKRHPFISNYKAGFNEQGELTAVDIELNGDAGSSTDLSMAILERALFHVDNAYFIPNIRVIGKMWKTNHPSNTAFRGFGAPQGMAVIEHILDIIARKLKIDTAEVRERNFYGIHDNNITHYGQIIELNRLPKLYSSLIKSSDYFGRKKLIQDFNRSNKYVKKGISLTPVKFGISFTTSFLNQAGALVNIYNDGSILVNHGGVEMGQGLHTKIINITAAEFGIDKDVIKVSATNTSKVPNTSATAASSGSDLNGMAVKNAVDKLKKRFIDVFEEQVTNKENSNIKNSNLIFEDNYVYHPEFPKHKMKFTDLVKQAYLQRIPLSATGFYKTPGIHYNAEKGKGNPFFYFAFGMAVSEVEIDTLTGSHKVIRTDILHDVGDSINTEIDKGQVIGGFVQGMGWCTSEEIKWDEKGNLLSKSPSTYKIPGIRDIPDDFRVELLS